MIYINDIYHANPACGTPHVKDMRSDDFQETLTDCVRPRKNDSRHDRAVPWTPNDICKRASKRLRVRLTPGPLQATLSKLLTYCLLPPTLSRTGNE